MKKYYKMDVIFFIKLIFIQIDFSIISFSLAFLLNRSKVNKVNGMYTIKNHGNLRKTE